ncbi:tetratricopeptide repeat protein [Alteromonas oceanisediminis]|uniref:tetratricopeptide repeat protein n=1 Tax=Alteromonas oceanisediminis TaxID=2836180 RepID=UPI001BDA2BDE|nr:hypothetical protein [Alteromonas oceanisediminis]MBT0586870.1 hypothetical protein [Alteromonas oceanisediminis]
MSVVNQMLKDLEQRNSDKTDGQAVYQPPVASQRKQRWALVIVVLLLILLVVAGYLAYPFLNADTRNADVVSAAQVPTAQAEPEPVKAKPMAVVVPREVVLHETEQTMAEPEAVPETATSVVPTDTTNEPVVAREASVTFDDSETETASVPVIVEVPVTVEPVTPPRSAQSASGVANPATFTKSSSSTVSRAPSLREKAAVAIKAGQEALAIELLGKLINTEPENIAARKKLAAMLFARSEATEARVVLEQGIVRFPEDASMRLMLARLLSQQNELNTAFAVLDPEQPLSDMSQEYRAYRAQLAQQLGEYTVALNDYQALLNEEPHSARWWLGVAIASERLAFPAQALEAYQRVARLDQLGPDVYQFAQQRAALLMGAQ